MKAVLDSNLVDRLWELALESGNLVDRLWELVVESGNLVGRFWELALMGTHCGVCKHTR